MIPFSILSGQLLAEGNSIQEISILDVSRIGFPFRVPKSFHKSWDAIRLQFYCRKDSTYREVVLRDVFCEMQQETEFFVVYRVETNQPGLQSGCDAADGGVQPIYFAQAGGGRRHFGADMGGLSGTDG